MSSSTNLRRKTETEPCSWRGCRNQAELGKYTVRSRHSGGALCNEHGTGTVGSGGIGFTEGQLARELEERARAAEAANYVDGVLERRARDRHSLWTDEDWRDALVLGVVSEDEARERGLDPYELRSAAAYASSGPGPELCPSGLWMVRYPDGCGYYSDYERAELRATYAHLPADEFRALVEREEEDR